MSIKRCNLNPVFVPYDLPIEDIETLGNYQPSELFGEIKGFTVPPYTLTVDKDKVPEINLDPPDGKILNYIDFNIENMKYKVPSNLKEAIVKLDNDLSEEDKQFLLENGALSVHHTLGRWIRNNWGLWDEQSELKLNMTKLGNIHPDDMSNFIIVDYIKHLKEQNEL